MNWKKANMDVVEEILDQYDETEYFRSIQPHHCSQCGEWITDIEDDNQVTDDCRHCGADADCIASVGRLAGMV